MSEVEFDYIDVEGGAPIKAWTRGVPIEDTARQQIANMAKLPFIHRHIAIMPDVHWGMGATVGSVIPTVGAIIPAAVGVDIGCGMAAVRTNNCHHNYVVKERHFGKDVWLTRKGAVRAGEGELGIIPGSMGAKSFIVRGKGNRESFETCSHGAGRAMSRNEARRRFTLDDHARATAHVECRKDEGVLDETPAAYKDIDAVMAAQADLVEVVHTLRQVVCVKG